MTKKIRLGEGSDYILVADGKQIYKFKDSGEAEARLRMLKSKFPQRNFELKHEVCSLQDVAEGLLNESDKFTSWYDWKDQAKSSGYTITKKDDKIVALNKQGQVVGHWSDVGKFLSGKAPRPNFKRPVEQGVAEDSGGNWYIRVNGKILNDTKFKPVIFSSEDEARSHAMKLADKKRIPLSQMKLTKSWMDEQDQGVAEGESQKVTTDQLKKMLTWPGLSDADKRLILQRLAATTLKHGMAEGSITERTIDMPFGSVTEPDPIDSSWAVSPDGEKFLDSAQQKLEKAWNEGGQDKASRVGVALSHYQIKQFGPSAGHANPDASGMTSEIGELFVQLRWHMQDQARTLNRSQHDIPDDDSENNDAQQDKIQFLKNNWKEFVQTLNTKEGRDKFRVFLNTNLPEWSVKDGFDYIRACIKANMMLDPNHWKNDLSESVTQSNAAKFISSVTSLLKRKQGIEEAYDEKTGRFFRPDSAAFRASRAAAGAPELLKAEIPLHRHIEQELAKGGWTKDDPEYKKAFSSSLAYYRKFGNAGQFNDQGLAEGKYCIKHRTTGKVLSTHDDKSSAQDELAGIASNKDYKVAKATAPKKEFSMKENKKQNVAEGFDKLSPQHKAHEYNLDAAQKEMDSRHAQGEDMTGAKIDKKTYKIVKPKKQGMAEDSEVASWIDAKGSTVPAKNRKDNAEKGAPVSGPSVSDRFRTSPHGDVVTAMNRKLHIPKVKESVALPDAKLMHNIAEGLVRMDDLVLNRPVYGNPSVTDRRVVQRMVREFAEAGIDYRDAVVELVEYFRQETIKEDGLPSIPPLPTAAPAAAAPAVAPAAAATTAAVTPDEAAKQEAAALAKIQANAGLKGQLDQLVTKSGTPAAAPAAPGQPAAAPDYTAALAKIKANAGLAPQLTALLAKAQ